MKSLKALDYLNTIDHLNQELGNVVDTAIGKLLDQVSSLCRMFPEPGDFKNVDALILQVIKGKVPNNRAQQLLINIDKLMRDVRFSEASLNKFKLTDSQALGARIAVKKLCTQALIAHVKDDIASEQLSVRLANRPIDLNLADTLQSLMIESMNVLVRRHYKQKVCPLATDSELTKHYWAYKNKPHIREKESMPATYSEEEKYKLKLMPKPKPEDNTIPVDNKNGNYPPVIQHMIALDPDLRQSTDKERIAHFVKLMNADTWHEDEMFQSDEDQYQYYAMSAMLEGNITPDQLGTVLRWRNGRAASQQFKTYPIFDGKKLSENAEKFLIPALKHETNDSTNLLTRVKLSDT